MFRSDGDPDPVFTEVLDLDLSAVVPSLAGPKRPQDRVALPDVWASFASAFGDRRDEQANELRDGAVVIAAITSCTNTSNPSVMVAAGLLAKKAVEAGLRDQAVGQDQPGAGLACRDRLPRSGRAHAVPGETRVRPGRVRLHHVHRELRSVARRCRVGGRRGRPERRRRAVREPQLRGADPPAGASQLPRVAAALRGVRAGRPRGRGPDHRADRRRRRRAGVPGGHLAEPRGGRRDHPDLDRPRPVRDGVRAHLGWRRSLGSAALADRTDVRLGSGVHLRAGSAVLRRTRRRRRRREHRGRARPGEGRRFDHDRPHLTGRFDQGGFTGGRVPQGAGREAERVQQLRGAPRQP